MVPHYQKIDSALSPGLTFITWTSLNVHSFAKAAEEEMKKLKLLLKRCTDILEYRINRLLKEITEVPLCLSEKPQGWTIQELSEKSAVCIPTYLPTYLHVRYGNY